jgi:hypothetical protein
MGNRDSQQEEQYEHGQAIINMENRDHQRGVQGY